MCNAYQHPKYCRCGWGKDQAYVTLGPDLSPSRLEQIKALVNKSNKDSVKAYLSPNAKCPVCGVNVFFFQSHNGGKVFFDDVGGDWPKHPCTSIIYKRNRFRQKIDTQRWFEVNGVNVIPSDQSDCTLVIGECLDPTRLIFQEIVISIHQFMNQNLVPIWKVFLPKEVELSLATSGEALIIFDDGVHRFLPYKLEQMKEINFAETQGQKTYSQQRSLF